MQLEIFKNPQELGKASAELAAKIINEEIKEKGFARIVLSTGASQFTFFEEFVKQDIDFSKVEMFHLDEYVGIDDRHIASFCRYLKERFISKVNLKKAHLISGVGDVKKTIADLTKEVRKSEICLGLIGIGENAHIAFNDPPADFSTKESFIVVTLNNTCKAQQVREGWFESEEKVCKEAITMSCNEILNCKNLISVVPFKVKADAIKLTVESDLTNQIPSTLLKTHKNFYLMCDKDSASKL